MDAARVEMKWERGRAGNVGKLAAETVAYRQVRCPEVVLRIEMN